MIIQWWQSVKVAELRMTNMRIITKEESNTLQFVPPVGFRRSEFTDLILGIDDDKGLLITKEEWKKKGYKLTPRRLLTAYYYNENSRLYKKKFIVKNTLQGLRRLAEKSRCRIGTLARKILA